MQKNVIKESFSRYRELLLSDRIVKKLFDLHNRHDSGDKRHSVWQSLKQSLITDIIESKSNYDSIIRKDKELLVISDAIEDKLYDTESISSLISKISNTEIESKKELLRNSAILNFISFHKSIIGSDKVNKKTITEEYQKENIVLFTIISESNPTVQKVITALEVLQKLIDLLEKLYDEERMNTVYILDKGSNINAGIETGVKTAKSLFLIFKEVWDWVANRKYYKGKLKNAAFVENLEIIQKINSMKEEGSLENEEALRYKTLIVKNIDELLKIDTIPAELAKLDKGKKDHLLLLNDYNETRLLSSGKDNSQLDSIEKEVDKENDS